MKKPSLIHLLWGFLVIASLLPIFTLSFYENIIFEQLYKQQIIQQFGNIADKKINEIETYIENQLTDILLLSRSRSTALAFTKIHQLFYTEGVLSEQYKIAEQNFNYRAHDYLDKGYYDVFLISLTGDVIFSALQENDFNTHLFDKSHEKSALTQIVRQSNILLSPQFSTFKFYQPSQKPAAFLASPIIDNGKHIGTIALQLDLKKIHSVILDDIGLGQTGETVTAVSSNNNLLFTAPLKTDPTAAFKRTIFQKNIPEPIKKGLLGQNGNGISLDYRGKAVIASWRYLPSLQWGMVIKQDLVEAMKPIKTMQNNLFIILTVLMTLLTFFSVLLGKKIVSPISSLDHIIKSFLNNNHFLKVPTKGFKEVAHLTHSFNQMIDKLLLYQHDLEDQIQQRTKALAQASKIIQATSEAIVITDLNANIIDANPSYCRLFGYEKKELIGANPNILNSGKQDRTFYKQFWQQIHTQGSWSGEMWNRRKNGELLPVLLNISTIYDEQGKAINYVGILTNIELIKKQEHLLERLAYYDPLTNLPNRMLLNDRLSQAITQSMRNKDMIAVMFIDLDRFKAVNDTLGHNAGDELLQITAKRIQNLLRENDTVSRIGGDEFVIILTDIHSTANAAHIAEKVILSVSKGITLQGQEVFVGASIGISFFPEDGNDSNTLLKHADIAMYQSKNNGRGHFSFYAKELDKYYAQSLEIEAELRAAITSNQLHLVYQPQISLKTGQLIGAEALLRWNHLSKKAISPDEFIPIAESTGLIDEIDQWVLKQAFKQINHWNKMHLTAITIAINLSAKRFENPKLLEQIEQYIHQYQITASQIELEITERTLMNNPQKGLKIMNKLAQLGITMSIDDFGTGYSSLSYLKRFPITKLKIDKSFVDGIPHDKSDVAISTSVINLAKGLGMLVIAEGVETEQQKKFMTDHNCDEAQGYFFSQPLEVSEFEKRWLRK